MRFSRWRKSNVPARKQAEANIYLVRNSNAALSDEELVDELIIINGLVSEVSQPPQKGAVTNGILDELELLYEINPSLELS